MKNNNSGCSLAFLPEGKKFTVEAETDIYKVVAQHNNTYKNLPLYYATTVTAYGFLLRVDSRVIVNSIN
jgi:hypothetical protein